MMPALRLAVAVLAATTTLAFQACPATAPAAPRLDSALRAKYVDANGEPIKAALSAYMHFCGDERATVTASVKAAEGAAFKQTKVMTKLGELWRALDSATVDSYKARAAADKERYDAALAAAGILTPKQKKASKPKRPLSAYMLFCQERRPALTETLKASLGPGFKYTVVMTKLGEEWRELSDGAKVKYQDMAAAEKAKAA